MRTRHDGQWLGRTDGDTPGWAVIELEHVTDTQLTGIAYSFPDDPTIASAAVQIEMAAGQNRFEGKDLPVIGFRPQDGFVFPYDRVSEVFPESLISSHADVAVDFVGDVARVEFKTALVTGYGDLRKGHADPN